MAVRALNRGASDFIPKSVGPAALLDRIRALLDWQADNWQRHAEASQLKLALNTLTPREREVLSHASEGRDIEHTALYLDISPRTVEVHHSHIAHKCSVANLADLFRVAAFHGIPLQAARGTGSIG